MKKLLLLILLTFGLAHAHTFKFILSTGPGSGSDMAIETFTGCFKKQNILVQKEFKPGAEGLIAMKAMQSAPNTNEMTHVLVGNLGLNMLSKFPNNDLLEDVNPITYLTHTSLVFVTKPGMSFDDAIKNTNGKPVTIGTTFIGGTWLAQNLFNTIGVPYQIVPYKNNVNSTIDVVNGSLDIAVDTFLAAKQLAEVGRIQIALSSLNRKDARKHNLPSIEKYDSNLAAIPFGPILSVSPSTRQQYKDLLEKSVIECNKDEETTQNIKRLGGDPVIMTTETLRKIVKSVSSKN